MIPVRARLPAPESPLQRTEDLPPRRSVAWHQLGLAGVLALTVALRFPLLTTIPVGLHFDEAWSGLDAASVTWSHHPVFFTDSNGMEPLYLYLQTLSIFLFGHTAFALRVVSAVLGTLTVPALYLLVRRLAGRNAGLLAAAILAVTYWHVHVSRLGYRAIALPLVECLAWWALWNGVAQKDRRWLALGGGLVGLSLYTYSTARAFPLAVALWFAWLAVRQRRWRPILDLLIVAAGAVVVFAPLGWYFLQHPQEFLARVGQVVVLSPAVAGNGHVSVLTGVIRTLGMFSFHGDPQWKYNLSGKPIFDPFMSAVFYLGIGYCLYQLLRRRGGEGAPLLLIWFAVMIIPGFVTTDPPETLHTLATAPVVCTFPALGLLLAWRWVTQRWSGLSRLAAAPAVALILVEAAITAYSYFVIWAPNPRTYYWLHGDVADLARKLEQAPATSRLYVATEYYRHPTIRFLAPGAAPRITWFDAARSFPVRTGNLPTIFAFGHGFQPLPEAAAALTSAVTDTPRDREGGIKYRWYSLPGPPRLPPVAKPLDVTFGQDVALEGVAVANDPGAGNVVQVSVRWHVLRRPTQRLSLFVHLLDSTGYRWAQADGQGYLGDDWQPGDEVLTVGQVALPPGTPPAPLTVSTGWYDVASGALLPFQPPLGVGIAADGGLVAGQVTPVPTPASAAAAVPGARKPVVLAPNLELVGSTISAADVRQGDSVTVILYVLKTASGAIAEPKVEIGGAGVDGEPLPAGSLLERLPPGSVLAIRHVLLISARAPAGAVSVQAAGPGAPPIVLSTIHITALPRAFAAPAPQHPMAVRLGSIAELMGYDVTPQPVAPGGTLHVTLYWRALSTADVRYTVFTHLLAPDGQQVGQHDGPPAGNRWPTTSWLPGQIIADAHLLTIANSAPPGSYTLQVGLYDASGERLAASGPAGQVGRDYATLGPIAVR